MPEEISRRSVIIGAAIIPIAAIRSAAETTATALSTDQLKMLNALVDRIIPADENGPGARECGAANYIDRALTDALAGEKASFVQGLAVIDAHVQKEHGKAFAELSEEARDTVLTAMEGNKVPDFPAARAFFTRVRRLTLEGTFSDPYYGGNRGFAGWDLIGYPGPRLAVSAEEQKMRVQIKPIHTSVWGGRMGGANGH